MSNNNKKELINVIWVEDNKELHDYISLQAETYGIRLFPYTCWSKAENVIESDYDKWSAIILDAKCKVDEDSIDSSYKFLTHVFSRLSHLSTKHRRNIPWFVLSGGGADKGPIDELIIDERKKWDKNWNKRFYKKGVDEERLFDNIKEVAESMSDIQIKESLYPDVFQAIREIGLPEEAKDYMMKLLKPIHFNVEGNDAYNNHFEFPRLILEYIYRSMVSHNILPQDMINNRGKDSVNLSACSKLLGSGSISEYGVKVDYPSKIFPVIIRNMVWNMTTIIGSYVHTTSDDSDAKETVDTKGHIDSVGGSPYLLRKIANELCDIILWYKDFLHKHPNDEENLKLWTKK